MGNIDKKFKEDKLGFNVITNDMLVCKDCYWRKNDKLVPANVCRCNAYNIKPLAVLDGGQCDKYIKDQRRGG